MDIRPILKPGCPDFLVQLLAMQASLPKRTRLMKDIERYIGSNKAAPLFPLNQFHRLNVFEHTLFLAVIIWHYSDELKKTGIDPTLAILILFFHDDHETAPTFADFGAVEKLLMDKAKQDKLLRLEQAALAWARREYSPHFNGELKKLELPFPLNNHTYETITTLYQKKETLTARFCSFLDKVFCMAEAVMQLRQGDVNFAEVLVNQQVRFAQIFSQWPDLYAALHKKGFEMDFVKTDAVVRITSDFAKPLTVDTLRLKTGFIVYDDFVKVLFTYFNEEYLYNIFLFERTSALKYSPEGGSPTSTTS